MDLDPVVRKRQLLDDLPYSIRRSLMTPSPTGTVESERRRSSLDDVPAQIRRRLLEPSDRQVTSLAEPPDDQARPPKRDSDTLLHNQPREKRRELSEEFVMPTLPAKRVHEPLVVGLQDIPVLLTGNSRVTKEVRMRELNSFQQESMRIAMAKEWSKWSEFSATEPCTAAQLAGIRASHPTAKIIDTRWVLTIKPDGSSKARLVVVGCQEPKLNIRSDAPTASHEALMLTLAFGAQSGWSLLGYDAQTAYLQSEGIERLLLLRLPAENPPPGCLSNQVVVANGSIYGTRDAGRAWYLRVKEIADSSDVRTVESALHKGAYFMCDSQSRLASVIHSHVDDFLVAYNGDPTIRRRIDRLSEKLRMLAKTFPFEYCGELIHVSASQIRVTQSRAALAIEPIVLDESRSKQAESPVTDAERSSYRSVVGQLMWLSGQTRPDLGFVTSAAAQRTMKATVSDIKSLNRAVELAHQHAGEGIVFRRGVVDMKGAAIVSFGDSAFANVEGCKSQFGTVLCLTNQPDLVAQGRFDLCAPIAWVSGTVKRVVRSTLAAEAYAISEALETGELCRTFLSEAFSPSVSLKGLDDQMTRAIYVHTDAMNLKTTCMRDCGSVADKRLRIVVAMLRESFQSSRNTHLAWIATGKMVADALTKAMDTGILRRFFETVACKQHEGKFVA